MRTPFRAATATEPVPTTTSPLVLISPVAAPVAEPILSPPLLIAVPPLAVTVIVGVVPSLVSVISAEGVPACARRKTLLVFPPLGAYELSESELSSPATGSALRVTLCDGDADSSADSRPRRVVPSDL